uniref:Small ribosomal subunit protein bS16m n=1 Tax=Meloidogyne javanica TaxID=6303 RepID=A0A915MC54_MELJA
MRFFSYEDIDIHDEDELIKYENDQIDTLLKNIGVNPDKWNLFIYNDSNNPNQNFLLFDPARGFEKSEDVSEPVYSFISKMTNYLNITSNQPIRRYTQTPFMEISGDCVNPATFGRPYIYLANFGCSNRPVYHIAVYPDKALGEHYRGNMIENLGTFDPIPNDRNEKLVSLKFDRLKYWLGVRNAEVSVPLLELLGLSGLLPLHPNTFVRARAYRRLMYKSLEKAKEGKDDKGDEKASQNEEQTSN